MYKFIIPDIKTKQINTEKKEQGILIFEYWEYIFEIRSTPYDFNKLIIKSMMHAKYKNCFFLYFQELLNHAMYFIFYFLYWNKNMIFWIYLAICNLKYKCIFERWNFFCFYILLLLLLLLQKNKFIFMCKFIILNIKYQRVKKINMENPKLIAKWFKIWKIIKIKIRHVWQNIKNK